MSPHQTVLNLKEALEKDIVAVIDEKDDSNDSLERIDDIFNRLNEVDMTLDILQESLIGATVNKLRKHKILGTRAKSLIIKWKSVAASQSNDVEKNVKLKKIIQDKDDSDRGAKKRKIGTKTKESDNSNNKDDGSAYLIETIIPENEWSNLPDQRQSICEKIFQTLFSHKKELIRAGLNEAAVINLIAPRTVEIENAIYSKCKGDKKTYTDKARSIVFNLKKNVALSIDVSMGHVEADEIASYTTEQLASTSVIEARQKTAQKLIDSRRLDWDQANEDKINKQCGITGDLLKASLFTCSRCKSIKTTSTQKQTRSADEPMTVFVLCLNCGKRWKC